MSVKISAHSETMTVAQAEKMMRFINSAIKEAPEFISRGRRGAKMKRPAVMWINGEKLALASSAVEGAGDVVGPVAVVLADKGETIHLSFVPSRGPEAIYGFKRL